MGIVDICIAVFALLLALSGWRSGFVRSAGSLLALIASIVASFYGMDWLRETYNLSFVDHPWLTILAFLLLTFVVSKVAQYIVEALDLVRRILAIIPFVNLLNNLLGAVFGVAQAAAAVAVLAYVTVTLVPLGDLRTSLLSSVAVSRAVDIESNAGLL